MCHPHVASESRCLVGASKFPKLPRCPQCLRTKNCIFVMAEKEAKKNSAPLILRVAEDISDGDLAFQAWIDVSRYVEGRGR